MAAGLAIGARSWTVAALIAVHMTATIVAAVRQEEAFLRARFGDEYDAYAGRRATAMERRFSFERARRNREYRAVAGLAIAIALLVIKAAFF
jgi:hypothetical protein